MNVGNSVWKAIDDWESGEIDAAMLHACNAIDDAILLRRVWRDEFLLQR